MVRSSCAILLLSLSSLISIGVEAAAIDSLKAFIQETRTVRANFSQTLYDKNARTLQESNGTMQFERPEKFRWTYEKPYEQLIVGDRYVFLRNLYLKRRQLLIEGGPREPDFDDGFDDEFGDEAP